MKTELEISVAKVPKGTSLNTLSQRLKESEEAAVKEEAKSKYEQMYQAAFIDPAVTYVESPVVLKIGGSPIASLGNFSCISGKAKSRKTFLSTIFAAAFLRGEIEHIEALSFSGKNRVVWFDTEQSRDHVQRAQNRALRLAGGAELHQLQVFGLREFSTKERREFINLVLGEMNPEKDIAFVILDGVRDLVFDINDSEEAADCLTWLMRLTSQADLHICTVLHLNKGNEQLRGHLGTEIINKSETVLTVDLKKNTEISEVSATYCRDKEFSPFGFAINPDGLPYVFQNIESTSENENSKRKLTPATLSDDEHKAAFAEVFKTRTELSRAEVLTAIKNVYSDLGYEFGDNKARDFLDHAERRGYVMHNGGATRSAKFLPGLCVQQTAEKNRKNSSESAI